MTVRTEITCQTNSAAVSNCIFTYFVINLHICLYTYLLCIALHLFMYLFTCIYIKIYIIALMMEAARTSETSVDNYFTRQYIPEDKSELYIYISSP
jgi:hypothetical protein